MPKPEHIAAKLATAFGPDSVKVRSPHHLTVIIGKAAHQVYLSQGGGTKLHMAGQAKAQPMTVDKIIYRIQNWSPAATAHSRMVEAAQLTSLVNHVISSHNEDQGAIYVDAGWKDGIGRVGLVMILPSPIAPEVRARSFSVSALTSSDAERMAIEEGLRMDPVLPVRSDCQTVCRQFAETRRVEWINRKVNRHADAIGNVRKGSN